MLNILKRIHISTLLLFLLIALLFWNWWMPGVRVSNDLAYVSNPILFEQFDFPRLWHDRGAEGFGQFGSFVLWSWPINLFSGLLAIIGFNFSVQERMLFIVPIIIFGIYGIHNILRRYGISRPGVFVSTLFYLTSTYLILLIDGGQLSIALSYALFPSVYFHSISSIRGDLKDKIKSVLLLFVFLSLDVRFVFVLLILLIIRFIYEIIFFPVENRVQTVKQWILGGLFISIILSFLNFYWIFPLKIFSISSDTFSSLTQSIGKHVTTWKHATLFLQPQWYKNVFGLVPKIRYEFVLIPVIVLYSLSVFVENKFKNKTITLIRYDVFFWSIIAFIGVFLSKGTNPPFGSIYNYLFRNIPAFSLFRDSTKFFFLVALSYSVLISVAVDKLTKRIGWKLIIGKWKIQVIPLLLIVYLLLLIAPVYLGKMTGMFSKPINETQFKQIENIIKNDNQFGRVFWIPSIAPLGYSDPNHTSLEVLRLTKIRPFAVGIVGTYETANFVREAPFMGELFDVAGIKYITYPYPDTRREELKQDNIDYYYAFLNQLTNLDWVEEKISEPPVAVLKTKKNQDHFFIADNTWFVVGSDRIYNDLFQIPNLEFSDNAMVFAEENVGVSEMLENNTHAKVLLYDKELIDFAATLIDESKFIFPAKDLDFEPDTRGWWKREATDLIWWRDFLQQKYGIDNLDFDYGGGWAVAEGERELTVNNLGFVKDDVLLARIMTSNRGGKVEFWQGDEIIGEIYTKIENSEKVEVKLTGYKDIFDQYFEYDRAGFDWYEIGEIANDSLQLTIKTEGEINVVNALVSISGTQWSHISKLVDRFDVINWNELSDGEKEEMFRSKSRIELSYERINPTHYKVNIKGLEKPATLAFSETYDPFWEIAAVDIDDWTKSYPLYSLVNGFQIQKDGEYDVYFSPQKYVLPGLSVSVATLALITLLLLLLPKRKDTKI